MSTKPSLYVNAIQKILEPHRNPGKAAPMRSYMKNRFEFLGITSPERRVLFTEFLSENGLPEPSEIESIVRGLFALPEREFQYFAVELTGKLKKHWTAESLSLFEWMAVTNSWWDSVDQIKSVCLRDYFLKFTDERSEITERWIGSGNIWLQRLSVIFQLGYGDRTDTRLLSRNINLLKESGEFFVQKGIGWALRDFARTDPEFVRKFVRDNGLKPLSMREALKNLK